MKYPIEIDIPDGCLVKEFVVVASYYTPDGESRYTVSCQGGAALSTYLGLAAFAQVEIADMRRP